MNVKWIVSVFLLGVMFYVFDVRPSINELNLLRAKHQQLQQALHANRKPTKKAHVIQPRKLQQTEVVTVLTKMLITNGFSIQSIELIKMTHHIEVEMMTFTIVAYAVSNAELEKFVNQLEVIPYFIALNDLQLRRVNNAIEVKMKINVFSIENGSKNFSAFKQIGGFQINGEDITILKNTNGEIKTINI